MRAHTPGPWHAVGTQVETESDDVADICTCEPALFGQDKLPRDYAEQCANARLIASAPDLLEALQTCMAALHWNEEAGCLTGITGDQWHAALDIIAKATGEAA